MITPPDNNGLGPLLRATSMAQPVLDALGTPANDETEGSLLGVDLESIE
jgi:hypothetical protein